MLVGEPFVTCGVLVALTGLSAPKVVEAVSVALRVLSAEPSLIVTELVYVPAAFGYARSSTESLAPLIRTPTFQTIGPELLPMGGAEFGTVAPTGTPAYSRPEGSVSVMTTFAPAAMPMLA